MDAGQLSIQAEQGVPLGLSTSIQRGQLILPVWDLVPISKLKAGDSYAYRLYDDQSGIFREQYSIKYLLSKMRYYSSVRTQVAPGLSILPV